VTNAAMRGIKWGLLLLLAAPAWAQDMPLGASWPYFPLMDMAVYYDGTGHIEAPVPHMGWPWPSGEAFSGLAVFWLKAGPSPSKTAIHQWSLLQTDPKVDVAKDAGPTGIAMDLGFLHFGNADLDVHQFFASDTSLTPSVLQWDSILGLGILPGKWVAVIESWDTVAGKFEICTAQITLGVLAEYCPPDEDLYKYYFPTDGGWHIDTDNVSKMYFFERQLAAAVGTAAIGAISQVWITLGKFHPIRVDASIRRKFVDPTGHQMYLGPHGEEPFGFSADFYFGGAGLYQRWGCNYGQGPDSHNVGRVPPRVPGPNAEITVGPAGTGGWQPRFAPGQAFFPFVQHQGNC
jgi:hypothetical protein